MEVSMTAVTRDEHHSAPARRPPFIGADGTYTGIGQTLAFVLGVISLVMPLFTLAAALLYTHAESRHATDPAGARQLVNWSWIALLVVPVIAVVTGLVALLVVVVS
jgi:hypothetical protein